MIEQDETTTISVEITNTGSITGAEVVQLYIGDDVASIVRYYNDVVVSLVVVVAMVIVMVFVWCLVVDVKLMM